MGKRPIDGGGGRDAVFNHVVDPHLRIMERLEDMTWAAHSKNLLIPLEADADLPTIRYQGDEEVLGTRRPCHIFKSLHDPQMRVYYMVKYCVSSTSPAAWTCYHTVSVRFPASVLLLRWPIHPYRS